MTRWLVTGGAGFIGSNFVRLLLRERPDATVVNLDALTYAGNLENLRDVEQDLRYRFVRGDIADPLAWEAAALQGGGFDVLVHFAAETHVDRSIGDPFPFLRTNVLGTQAMLDFARRNGIARFVQVGTDEVYGTLGPDEPSFRTDSPILPNSPYAASKASADLLVRAAARTHGLEAVITRCSNNYGPFQFPEKFLPLMITNAMSDQSLPVYGDGMQVRDWLHVDDHNRAILAAAERGRPGGVYNIGGHDGERPNLVLLKELLAILGKPESLIRHVEDRKGHDRRYSIDASVARAELGWAPQVRLEDGLRATVEWYKSNEGWWRRVKSGAYREYYETMYSGRLRDAEGRR
ncbi:MAG: dTDP-glucose 4,6-dehydratase [Planctomycetes bacterium]|nr:dTDP-glucose 4,6-dehydratase [Planctomycetota bacterium]